MNGFEVTQLLREGGSKSPSGLKRVKLSIAWMEMDCSFEKKMTNYLKVVFIPYRKMSPIIDRKKKKKNAHCLPFDRITKYHPFRVPSTAKDG